MFPLSSRDLLAFESSDPFLCRATKKGAYLPFFANCDKSSFSFVVLFSIKINEYLLAIPLYRKNCTKHYKINDRISLQGWETLTNAVVKQISDQCTGVVFLLWGAYAAKKALVVDAKKHHLLKSVHPSPLSAHRGFLGCQHFSLCNEILENQGKSPIDWKRLDDDLD